MNPTASIVIPTRGGAERLPHLFRALRSQTEDSWEAIVVVDGDIDGTAALLDQLRTELPIRPIVFPENRGRSAALSAGFLAARGDILIRCDDDLRPAVDYVAGHIALHQKDPVGVVGLYRNVYPDTPYAHAYGIERDARFRDEAYSVTPNMRWRYWAGNVSVTSETYRRVGSYDTAYRGYGWEDVDWGYRLHAAGVPVILARELETPHYVAATTTEIRVARAFHSGAARRTFIAKHGGSMFGNPRPYGIWGGLVAHTAHRSLPVLRRSARRVDKSLPFTPHWLAEKRVSLLVEAASLAGELHPDDVSTDV